jgi:hypothetical protein
MKNALLLIAASFFLTSLSAQTRKHDWLVGGSALMHSKLTRTILTADAVRNVKVRHTDINLSPDAGYFLSDRFVVGARLLYATHKAKVLEGANFPSSVTKDYGAGPFVRYYFFPGKNRFNLLVDGSYQFGTQKQTVNVFVDGQPYSSSVTSNRGHTASITAGPVYNLTSKIGLELLGAYIASKYSGFSGKSDMFMAGLGVHVYL